MMPAEVHASVSPSRLQRVVDCPGSFKLAQKYTEDQSSYAAEGTLLHLAIERWLLDEWQQGEGQNLSDPRIDPNIVSPALDKEQIIAITDCLIYLGQLLKTLDNPEVYIEKKVGLSKYNSCLFECWGTSDIIVRTWNQVHALDWKFGKGIPVYAEDNDQAYAYLAGACKDWDMLQSYDSVHVHIVQPRLDIFDHHQMTPQDLAFWLESRVIPGVTRAYAEHPPFNPGKKQCRWCPAKIGCRARHNFVNQVAADVFQAVSKMPDKVSIEELSETYKNAQQYLDYISDLGKFIQKRIESGRPVPGYKMVHGRSIRAFAQPGKAEEWLLSHCDHEHIYQVKLSSPAQMEKADRSLRRNQEFQDLIIKPDGKPTLVPETDKRPPIEYRDAAQIFAEVIDDAETR